MQSILEGYGANLEIIDLLCPFKEGYKKILYSNWMIIKLLIESRGKILNDSVAYVHDMLSVYKFFIFILLGGKFILDVHDYDFDRAPYGVKRYSLVYNLNLALLRFSIKRAKVVLTVSDLMSRFLRIKFGSNHKTTVTLFNSYYEPECTCENSAQLLGKRLPNEYRLAFVGMKNIKRGSAELIESIQTKICREIDFKALITAIWFGGSEDYQQYISGRSKTTDFQQISTSLLCQACLRKGVSDSDIGIHAYKPDFANARHAVPNKLFTLVNFRPRYTIFSGDLECKRIITRKLSENDFTWISSHKCWENTLDLIGDSVVSYLKNQKTNSTKVESAADPGLSDGAVFEKINEVGLAKLKRVVFC